MVDHSESAKDSPTLGEVFNTPPPPPNYSEVADAADHSDDHIGDNHSDGPNEDSEVANTADHSNDHTGDNQSDGPNEDSEVADGADHYDDPTGDTRVAASEPHLIDSAKAFSVHDPKGIQLEVDLSHWFNTRDSQVQQTHTTVEPSAETESNGQDHHMITSLKSKSTPVNHMSLLEAKGTIVKEPQIISEALREEEWEGNGENVSSVNDNNESYHLSATIKNMKAINLVVDLNHNMLTSLSSQDMINNTKEGELLDNMKVANIEVDDMRDTQQDSDK
ncbi:hypothetical protein HAX54_049284 [Datura stramonium]|uniref:Uncharacterized protein n=1 Tax=Datura stramonium TaxID=4076 RepID=A0ABS8SWB8_DATST|nr:hypothetical protein [Datura stramonium]